MMRMVRASVRLLGGPSVFPVAGSLAPSGFTLMGYVIKALPLESWAISATTGNRIRGVRGLHGSGRRRGTQRAGDEAEGEHHEHDGNLERTGSEEKKRARQEHQGSRPAVPGR